MASYDVENLQDYIKARIVDEYDDVPVMSAVASIHADDRWMVARKRGAGDRDHGLDYEIAGALCALVRRDDDLCERIASYLALEGHYEDDYFDDLENGRLPGQFNEDDPREER